MQRLLSLFLLTAVVLVSCKKDTGGGGSDPTQIMLNVNDARPLQILSVGVTGIIVQPEGHSGSIGGVDVEFHRSNEFSHNSLVCLVPENVGVGMQTLSIEIDGETFTSTLNVLPNESIGTPEDVFDTFYADYTGSEYTGYIDEAAFQIALDNLRNLPESDRLIAAQMLANNRVALDNIAAAIANAEAETGLGFGKTQSCDMLCAIGAAAAVIGAVLSAPIATAVGLGVVVGYVLDAMQPVASALWDKAVAGIVSAIKLGYDRMAYVTELVYDEANQMISNKVEEIPDTIYLENGSPLQLAIKTVREPIISESNRDEYAEVANFLDLYYRLQNFLLGTDYEVPMLESGEVEDFALDLDDFSISVDNPLVTVSEITGTPELAQVSFDSQEEGAHTFNFTYTYVNDEGTSSSFTQTARLLNIIEYSSWSGAGVSFASADPYFSYGRIQINNTRLRLFLGNRGSQPGCTGVVSLDEIEIKIAGYDGVGVYTPNDTASGLDGIMLLSAYTNATYDCDAGQSIDDNLCWYYCDNIEFPSNDPIEDIAGTVTITDEEWIGPYLVVEGEFNLTAKENGNLAGGGAGGCSLPATFTGEFRVACSE